MGYLCCWNGTLSSSEFGFAAKTLSEKWEVVNPGLPPWKWIPCPRSFHLSSPEVVGEEGYLSLENLHQLSSRGYASSSPPEKPENEDEEFVDSATLVQSDDKELHSYDFHIIYSSSYRVPVLYFRGYRSDGQILALEEIESNLPVNSLERLRESKWTFMTREEHPYLNRPWYTLHPCGTSEWMKLMFRGGGDSLDQEGVASQYLVSWLSVVGQVVGLRVPLEINLSSSCQLTAVQSVPSSTQVDD